MTLGSIIAFAAEGSGKVGGQVASIGDALLYALFTISVVFLALLIIFVCIKIFSAILNAFDHKKDTSTEAPAAAAATSAPAAPKAAPAPEEEFSSGTLKLKGCDEKTAAMIMAIVSDNTGIPLSELVFKSITLVENK
ncbi:Oxaloacetate decarboxylase, gamma chain [Ruminococcaceae bacterium YRB3002]|nr:Oxaloacetate decarboxylase, gamma chain [Ruminococcaceae bacterium YRB3002]